MARCFAAAIVALGLTACSGRARTQPIHTTPTPQADARSSSVSMAEQGRFAPVDRAPSSSPLVGAMAARYRALASRARPCRFAQIANRIHGTLFIGCSAGSIVAFDTRGDLLASANVRMDGITSIVSAGSREIAISGYNDGASLRNGLAILRVRNLRPVGPKLIEDSTFLGVIGDRAYIDDWCCFGRPNEYRPATIYSISLKNGSESRPVDLTPDPQAHPANMQPLGQGEHNYLKRRYLYVVVGPITYRYNMMDLARRPRRMFTPKTSP